MTLTSSNLFAQTGTLAPSAPRLSRTVAFIIAFKPPKAWYCCAPLTERMCLANLCGVSFSRLQRGRS